MNALGGHVSRTSPPTPTPQSSAPACELGRRTMRGFERIMPKLLPYDADDDEAAEQYVREALRRSQRGNWTALLADDRVVQTYRVLRRIEAGAAQAHIRHREAIRQAEIDRESGLISDVEFAGNYRNVVGW